MSTFPKTNWLDVRIDGGAVAHQGRARAALSLQAGHPLVEQVGHRAPPALAVAAPCDLGRQGISRPLGIPLVPMDLAEHVAVPPGLRVALAERDRTCQELAPLLRTDPLMARA
jgi:hypothetical protein